MIELTYSDERRIEQVLAAEGDEAEAARREYLPAIRELQNHNIARAERLAGKLEAAASAPPTPGPDGSMPDEEAAEIQQQRFELAGQLLTLALARMDDVVIHLAESGKVKWSEGHEASRSAVDHLEALRRLFFSIVEELRDAAQQQLDLADETRDAAALSAAGSDDAAARIGPLAPRQEALAARAGDIADALAEQSNQAGGVVDEEADSAETSRRLREAGEHVLLAQVEMEGATEKLAEDPPNLESTQERQAASIAELEQALALLVPPEDREPEGEPDLPSTGFRVRAIGRRGGAGGRIGAASGARRSRPTPAGRSRSRGAAPARSRTARNRRLRHGGEGLVRVVGVFLLVLVAAAAAAAQTVSVQSTPAPHYAGESIEIHVVVEGFDEDPAPSVVVASPPRGKLIAGGVHPSVSTSISIVNGQMRRTKEVKFTFVYQLQVAEPGPSRLARLRLRRAIRALRVVRFAWTSRRFRRVTRWLSNWSFRIHPSMLASAFQLPSGSG